MTLIDDEELLLLYDLNSSKNLDLPSWRYDKFDLDTLTDAECKSEFRFLKHDIYTLLDVLRGHDCKYRESLARLKKIENSDNLSEKPLWGIIFEKIFSTSKNL